MNILFPLRGAFWPTLIFLSVFSINLEAKIVQILHTNDTHSFLDNSTHDTVRGGAARLKNLIDSYRSNMNELGGKTIVLDAGDFMEGNLYYMAEKGRKTFEIHNEMGYDIGILGNHDYLMGTQELDKLLSEIDLKFSLIVANVSVNSQYKNISKKIKPYTELNIDGVKIAVIGLTTDDMVFRWRLEGGKVESPVEAARRYEEILKKRGNDFILALTHIGVLNDIKLVEKTKYIDLVVGGHSHTALFEPSYGMNKLNKKVPVVQAGMHTEFLGRLVVDLVPGKPLKILSYELIPVTGEMVADPKVQQLVKEADFDLEATYGKDWLNEVIGFSDLMAGDKEGSVKWAYFITDTMKEKTGADIAIHVPSMNGENFPVGPITRRATFNSIPRIFDLQEKLGWNIYTAKMKGVWLRMIMTALSYHTAPITLSGIKLDYSRGPLGFKIRNITINGKKVNPAKTYKVAFTEGIIKGASEINPRSLAVLQNPIDSKIKIWTALEDRITEKAGRDAQTSIVKSIEEGRASGHSLLLP